VKNAPAMAKSQFVRVWSNVYPQANGCWLWRGHTLKTGYGQINIGGRKGKMWLPHRLVYSMWYGEIPEGMVLDHLCQNKLCVFPDHLEPVTQRENTRRHFSQQTVCRRAGHPLKLTSEGCRRCPTCRKAERARAR
jgi:hypothetical protein